MCKIVETFVIGGLLCCAIHDLRKNEIPVIYFIGIGVVVVLGMFCVDPANVGERICGILIGLCCLLISKWTGQAVGYGDSLLILILGAHLGGVRLLEVLFVATFSAGLFALFCLWKRKWKRTATIAFVPFLTLAYMGVMFI